MQIRAGHVDSSPARQFEPATPIGAGHVDSRRVRLESTWPTRICVTDSRDSNVRGRLACTWPTPVSVADSNEHGRLQEGPAPDARTPKRRTTRSRTSRGRSPTASPASPSLGTSARSYRTVQHKNTEHSVHGTNDPNPMDRPAPVGVGAKPPPPTEHALNDRRIGTLRPPVRRRFLGIPPTTNRARTQRPADSERSTANTRTRSVRGREPMIPTPWTDPAPGGVGAEPPLWGCGGFAPTVSRPNPRTGSSRGNARRRTG